MEDVWLQGIIKCSNSNSLSPQRVLLSCSVEAAPLGSYSFSCIAICKYNTLQTQRLSDGPFGTPNYDTVHFPNVMQVSCSVNRGSSRANKEELPFILEASQSFLNNFSFYHGERVWFRSSNPASLEKAYLSVTQDDRITDDLIEQSIAQLYSLSKNETVILNQTFQYAHQPYPEQEFLINEHPDTSDSSSNDLIPNTQSGSEIPPTESETDLPGGCVTTAPPIVFNVVATTPTQQGRVSEKTDLIVIANEYEYSRKVGFSRTGTLEASGVSPGNESDDIEEDDDIFGERIASPHRLGSITPIKHRSASFSSASDFRYDDGFHEVLEDVDIPPVSLPQSLKLEVPRFLIEVRPVLNFKLQYHFILLPKSLSLQFNIFNLHNVLVTSLKPDSAQKGPPTYGNLVIPLKNNLRGGEGEEEGEEGVAEDRKHITIVRLYDNEIELQELCPLMKMGHRFTEQDLRSAYIHPELFFYLFPETLPIAPKRYHVEIEVKEFNYLLLYTCILHFYFLRCILKLIIFYNF